MSERINLVTPVGRIVEGDLWEPRTKDFQGNDLTVKTGPNAGQPRSEYYIGLAIPKDSPEWPAIYAAIYNEARRGFPNLFDAAGNFQGQKFAWKFADGDDTRLNLNNSRPCDKEGFPGHWVLRLSSSIAPKVYDRNNQPIDPATKAVKRGDYVRVQLSFVSNDQVANPGLYMSANMVQFSHQGQEIISGLNAAEVFGGTPMPAAPAGASTTPQPGMAPMMTGTTAPGSVAPAVPVNMSAPAAAGTPPAGMGVAGNAAAVPTQNVSMHGSSMATSSNQVTPAPDFLNPAPAPAAPAPVVEKFVVQGQAYTKDQLLAAGWSEAQINAQPKA